MKKINNKVLKTQDGKPIIDSVLNKELTSKLLIQMVFNNVEYKSREDQRLADKIYNKLDDIKDTDYLELENLEFDLVYKYSNYFQPFMNGRGFLPFLNELDRVKELKK